MQKCQTHYMGRVCGWHLAASGGGVLLQLIPQEPHAEPVYREGSRKGGGGRYCFYLSCFSLPTGKGLGGARLGQLFCAVLFCSLVRGEQEKRAMVPSPSPALVEKQANPCDCECGGHSWMLARLPLVEAHPCLTSACDLPPGEGGVAVPGSEWWMCVQTGRTEYLS